MATLQGRRESHKLVLSELKEEPAQQEEFEVIHNCIDPTEISSFLNSNNDLFELYSN